MAGAVTLSRKVLLGAGTACTSLVAAWWLGWLGALQDCADERVYPTLQQPIAHTISTNRALIGAGATCVVRLVNGYNGFFLVILTTALAVYTYRLWRDSSGAASAAKESANAAARSADAMQLTSGETRRLADAAQEQARIAEDHLRRTRRAWVAVSVPLDCRVTLGFRPQHAQVCIPFRLLNGGASPARCLTWNAELLVKPHPAVLDVVPLAGGTGLRGYALLPDPRDAIALTRQGGVLLVPGEPVERSITVMASRDDFEAAEDGRATIWVTGCVAYRDEFDESHYTTFHYMLIHHMGGNEDFLIPDGISVVRCAPIAVSHEAVAT